MAARPGRPIGSASCLARRRSYAKRATPQKRAYFGSQKSQRLEACVALAADHKVVVHENRQSLRGLGNLAGHRDIGLARGWIAARVIVDEDDGTRGQLECALDDFSRVDR